MKGTWHTGDCGGGGLILAVIAAAVLIGSGAASAVASALVSLLVTIAIIVGVVVVLAVAGMVALLVYRARQDRPGRPIAATAVWQLPRAEPQRLEAPERPAIGPGREVHLHLNVTPDQLAAILRHSTQEDR